MRRAPRADRPRLRVLPTVLLSVAILALPTVVYAWGRSSESFSITGVEVPKTRLVPRKQALRLLRKDYVGRNLFTVTGADVRKTLAPLCFVASVSVDRDFPETLAVTIKEYQPAAYALAGSRWYVLDGDGYVICTAAEAAKQLGKSKKAGKSSAGEGDEPSLTERLVAGPPKAPLDLPRIAVKGRVRVRTRLDDARTTTMLGVVTALPRSLQRRLDAVESDKNGRLTLRFTGGPVARWGDAERTLAKTVALRTALKEYEKRGQTCTSLDVSIPDRTLGKPVLE